MLDGAEAGGEEVAKVVDDLERGALADTLLEMGAANEVSLNRLVCGRRRLT